LAADILDVLLLTMRGASSNVDGRVGDIAGDMLTSLV
jgi:hypothetical protein